MARSRHEMNVRVYSYGCGRVCVCAHGHRDGQSKDMSKDTGMDMDILHGACSTEQGHKLLGLGHGHGHGHGRMGMDMDMDMDMDLFEIINFDIGYGIGLLRYWVRPISVS